LSECHELRATDHPKGDAMSEPMFAMIDWNDAKWSDQKAQLGLHDCYRS